MKRHTLEYSDRQLRLIRNATGELVLYEDIKDELDRVTRKLARAQAVIRSGEDLSGCIADGWPCDKCGCGDSCQARQVLADEKGEP